MNADPHPREWLPADTSKIDTSSATLRIGGLQEVAALLGVSRRRAWNWTMRRATSGFPEPLVELGMGPVYDLDAVQRWWDEKTEYH